MIHLHKYSPYILLTKRDPLVSILKAYFDADMNCLYQTKKKHITNPIKMFMNFSKTVYLSNIKEKSYIQIKKAQIGCIIGLCESTLTPSTKQELN